jgi:uncharacterized protein YkwD
MPALDHRFIKVFIKMFIVAGFAVAIASAAPLPAQASASSNALSQESGEEFLPGPLAMTYSAENLPPEQSEDPVHSLSPFREGEASAPVPSLAEQLVLKVNQYRNNNNLPPLKFNAALNKAAQDYAVRLGVGNFFGHNDPDFGCNKPSDRIVAAGYGSWLASGETIAAGYPTVDAAFDAFVKSQPHHDVILSASFREIGSGYYYDGNDAANVRQDGACPYINNDGGPYRHYWTLNFAARHQDGIPALPIVINNEAVSTTNQNVNVYVYGGLNGQPIWAKQMRFSENGLDWTPYENWTPTKAMMLSSGNGYKTLYAQITDGSFTQTVSDTIYLEGSQYSGPPLPVRAFLPFTVRK